MTKHVAYWVTTGVVALAMGSGGVAELIRQPQTVDGMRALGYPAYFISVIGGWKVLGSVTLLVPGFPRLKEWAYAGIFFNMTGAVVSHVAMGSAPWHVAVTASFVALTLGSWALRPASRRLAGTLRDGPTVSPAPTPQHGVAAA